MTRIREYFRSSIKRRITGMMVISFLPILIGGMMVPLSSIKIVHNYEHATNGFNEKQKDITDITNYTNEIILRVRGYFSYLDEYEYKQIFQTKHDLDNTLAIFKSRELTNDEQELVLRIEGFFDNYLTNVLPQGAEFAKNNDYNSLRQLVIQGENNPVNELILYAHKSEEQARVQLEYESNKLLQVLFGGGMLFITYVIIVLGVSIVITRRLSKDIGAPLQQLSQYARNYTVGESIDTDVLDRKDEIGHLSRSLNSMIYEIRENAEELLAQNEELQSQQDELETQQEELQRALSRMEKNELYLNKRNLLNQSLTNTLDKRELLDSIIRNVVEISQTDKGILLLMNKAQDHAAYGISPEETLQFLNGLGQGAVLRILYSKQLHIKERDATLGEKGYISGEQLAYDIFIPLYKGNGDITACMVLTRVGRAIGQRDEQELVGLAGQISLSLEKLEIFEAAEEQRQITQDMLNTIQEGVQLMDLEGKSLQVNKKLYDLMGLAYDDSQLKEMTLNHFMDHLSLKIEEPELVCGYIRSALNGEQEQDQRLNYMLKDEEERYIQMYWEPIYHNGEKYGILLVHRDITKEHEVDRMKSEFVSTVSHELRTPLASILGFSELMLHRELKPERQRKYMATIHQEAKRLTQLVNDFLDLQRMETGMQFYDSRPVDIISLVKEVQELQQASTADHRIVWKEPHELVSVFGDRDKLYQVLVNLVSNAIKYSPSGGEITITSRQEGDKIWINVADEGLGIPEQALPDVFTKFYRVDNSDRRQIGGTGLGLAIVKEIITQHHGEIEVKSQLGEGSTFSIILPIYGGTSAPTRAKTSSLGMNEAISLDVMIVENDLNLSIMLQDELVEKGYRTTVFCDGNSAIQAMQDHPPDIIVLDLKLEQEMSGWQVIKIMKASEILKGIPIIISSAFEEKEKAMQWGIAHFLIKPYASEKLIEAIESIASKGEIN